MERTLRLYLIILLVAATFLTGCATHYHLTKLKCIQLPCSGKTIFKEPKYQASLGIEDIYDARTHRYVDEIMIYPSLQTMQDLLSCYFQYQSMFTAIYTGGSYKNGDYYLICDLRDFDFSNDPYKPQFPNRTFPLTFEIRINANFARASTHDEIWSGTAYSTHTKYIVTWDDVIALIQDCLMEALGQIGEGVDAAMRREFPEQEKQPTTTAPQQQQEQQMQQQMSGPTIVITGGQTASGQQAVEIKEYGTVSFQSAPTGAEVYEGVYFLGNTPISKLKFQAGPHNITISMPGYKPWVRQLMVITNSDVNIKAELEKSE
jgi:hypothetical protein